MGTWAQKSWTPSHDSRSRTENLSFIVIILRPVREGSDPTQMSLFVNLLFPSFVEFGLSVSQAVVGEGKQFVYFSRRCHLGIVFLPFVWL